MFASRRSDGRGDVSIVGKRDAVPAGAASIVTASSPGFGRALRVGVIVACLCLAVFALLAVLAARMAPGGTLCQWDCKFYMSIAGHGYQTEPVAGSLYANFGFFPAFPILVAVAARITGLAVEHAALLLNAVLAVGFCVLALRYRLALGLVDETQTIVFLVAFMLSPWGLYSHVGYSEMLFNVSALGTFAFWKEGRLASAAVCGVVLTATRVTGVMLPLALLAELLWNDRRRLLPLLMEPDGRVRALAIMPLGLMAFMVYLYILIGDPLAYFHVQQVAWAQGLRNPVTMIAGSLRTGRLPLYDTLAFFIATALLVAGAALRRIPIGLAAFAWLTSAVAMASVLAGEPRYALGVFPVYLMAACIPIRFVWILMEVLALLLFFFLSWWFGGTAWLT